MPEVKPPSPQSRQPCRTERGEQRRRALMEAATDVFLERGYAGTSIEEIMRRVGGSRASLYSYFGNKEGLFLDILDTQSDKFMRDMGLPTTADDQVEQTLVAIGRRYMRTLMHSHRHSLFRVVVAESTRFPEVARKFYEQGPMRIRRRLGEYFRLQHEAGRLSCPNAELSASQFIELLRALPYWRVLMSMPPLPEGLTMEQHINGAVKLFLHGCANFPAQPAAAKPKKP